MADQDFSEFYARVARVEKARAQGYGFEADGTLGRSHYHRPTRRKRRFLAPLLMLVLCFATLKGVLHSQIGSDIYAQRISQMRLADSVIERIAGFLMQPDAATVWISAQVQRYLP